MPVSFVSKKGVAVRLENRLALRLLGALKDKMGIAGVQQQVTGRGNVSQSNAGQDLVDDLAADIC